MHILVPHFIIEKLKQGEKYGHFNAVALFIDISGFSSLTNSLMKLGQHGAEILATIMRSIFAPMINQVYKSNGFVSTFSGDAFTALFRIENDDDSAYHQALSCAFQIQEITKEQCCHKTPVGEFYLFSEIGISSGSINWGIITSEDQNRGAYYFRGYPIDGCIEAESFASEGEIILDEVTYKALQENITTEQIEGFHRVTSTSLSPEHLIELKEPQIDLSTAKIFYPESILTQDQSGEFRTVVNMFISLPTLRTEPQLEIFIEKIFSLQDRYGGLLNRIDFGDKGAHLLFFWGAPISYENDIGRALNFILALQTETSIPIKAGITYQIAHAGFIGNELREEYTCYGRGVNLAARFMTHADRGEVWIDGPIAERIKHAFEIEYEGEHEFKGFDTPQETYLLYERKENIQTLYQNPYIGRKKEFDQFLDAINQLEIGSTPIPILITGDAGIGKSRLIYEVKQSNTQNEVLWATCQTDQVLRNSFNPFRYWLKHYFGINPALSEIRNKRNFNKKLDELISSVQSHSHLAAELDRTRSFLGSLVNLYWEDSLFEQLDPQGKYDNTILGIISLLKAESINQPVILLIEDIQWIDDDSREILKSLYRSIYLTEENPLKIFIVATSRSTEEDDIFGEERKYQQLDLEKFSNPQVIELSSSILGGKISANLAKTLVDNSEGIPYFIEQITYFLRDNESLILLDDEWNLKDADNLIIPENIRTILVSRLDQASPNLKKAIQTASILGLEINPKLLTAILHPKIDFQDLLLQAEKNYFLTKINDQKYVFNSNLLRDAAYRMQTHAQRQNLHRLAVEAYETIYEGDLPSVYPELAHHSEHAQLTEKAIHYLKEAGVGAQNNYQNSQAIYYLTKAIVLSENTKDPGFFELLLLREKTYNLLGDRENQINDLRLADRSAKTLKDDTLLAKIANRYSYYYHDIGEYDRSIEYANESIKLAQKTNQPTIEISSLISFSLCARHKGEYENALAIGTEAYQISVREDNSYYICICLNSLALTQTELGNFDEAAEYLKLSLETVQDTSQFSLQAQTLNNLGNIYGEQGDYASAYGVYREALEIAEKTGTQMGQGILNTNLGWLAGLLGNYDAASEHFLESVRIAESIGDIYTHALSLVNLSLFTSTQGDQATALTHIQEATTILEKTGHKPGIAIALTYCGHIHSELKQYEEALNCYQEVLEIREELKQTSLAMEPRAGIANIQLRTGNLESARQTLAIILEHLDNGGNLDGIDQPFRIYNTCCQILLELDDPRAKTFITEAYQILVQQSEKIKDIQSRKSFLENVPFHRDITNLYEHTKTNMTNEASYDGS